MSPLTPVKSSQIQAIGFDATSSTLAVRFTRGTKTYLYRDVSPEVHQRFMASESKGVFFGAEIRGKFDFTAVDGDEEAKDDAAPSSSEPQVA
jgi:hypothetical protein